MLFLLYVNVSGMLPWSHLSSQPLTIPAPWIFLRIGWSITLVPPWVTTFRFLAGNIEDELKPINFSSFLLLNVVFPLFLSPLAV